MSCGVTRAKGVLYWMIAMLFALPMMSQSVSAGERTVIKVGTIWPANHSGTMGAVKFAELAMAKTNNAVDVRVMHSSLLGSEREMFEGIRLGSVEMGYIAGNIIQNVEPSAALPSLP